MNQPEMIQSLRAEIAKLQRVLDLLLDQSGDLEEVRRPGRPKGSGSKATSLDPEEFAPRKRTVSEAGKARIAAAQKKRWAARKTTFSDRVVRKQAASPKKASKTVPPKSARKVASTSRSKSAAAGKRTGSLQKRRTAAATAKTAAKQSVPRKASKPVAKRPAKRVPPTALEFQTTA